MNWINLLSRNRPGEKKPVNESLRSAFEQDFDRIIFSYPFRRLQDKTQVHPLPEHDFVHNRLTHSLEVSSVGRSLGRAVGQVIIERHPDLKKEYSAHDFASIVAAASLTHDIGNPPFGHSGESAISDFFTFGKGAAMKEMLAPSEYEDLAKFEGNAQGFRILNKPKYQGLRLTGATLAAFTKYPRPSLINERDKSRKSQKKFGYFQSERHVFNDVAETTGLLKVADGLWRRHPLAFLVEAADDICYNLIDLEDGCRLGLVSYEKVISLFADLLGARFNQEKLDAIPTLEEKIGTLRALGVGQLIHECVELFLDNEKDILAGNFDQALTDVIPSYKVLEEIVEISIEKIYRARLVLETESAGYEVLPGLLEAFTDAVLAVKKKEKLRNRHRTLFALLPKDVQMDIKSTDQIYANLMSVLDVISGMTDTHAISLYRKIKGISHPNL